MSKLLNIIKKFNKLKVLVIGDVMLDEYVTGDVNRISPEAPIPVLDVNQTDYFPGGAANAARNVRASGADIILAGVIGPEEKGKMLKNILKKQNINPQGLVIDKDRRTTVKSRVIAKDQQIVRVDSEERESIQSSTEKKILDLIKDKIKILDLIIISDYAKGVITTDLSKKIIEVARTNKTLCIVDPKGEDFSKYRGCNVISPNIDEMALALNFKKEDLEEGSKFLQAGKMLLSHIMSDKALITQHEQGMVLFDKQGKIIDHPAVNPKPRDISGAGDTAIANFGLSLAADAGLKEALVITSHACGIVVGKIGTAVASPEELKESLNKGFES